MKGKKLIYLIVSAFLFVTQLQSQTTYDFNTPAVISSGPAGFGFWNTQADITIGGVPYVLTSGGNGSFTNINTGGVSNSKALRKDGSGGDTFTLKRQDGQPFQFYGIWVQHQSMNSYTNPAFLNPPLTLPPWYTLTTTGQDSFTFQDMTAMTAGNQPTNYTSSSKTIDAGVNGVTVTSVQISFQAILYYKVDNIKVGPVVIACTPPVFSLNPSNVSTCNGSSVTLNAAATGATAYEWQVNTGSGYTTISNGGPYSNATTANLTISAVSTAMSGYTYRCVAINGVNTCFANSTAATLTVADFPTITQSQMNVSCNGGSNGSATVSLTGGTGTYAYSWSPSGGNASTATGLVAGNYSVTISDGTCSVIKNFTIQQPSAINGTTSVTNVSCFGGSNGSIDLTPTGGTPPYTFNWGGGITTEDRTGLTAGAYSVIITDANACSKTVNVTVNQPTNGVDGSAVVTNISCTGGLTGAIDLTPMGGTPPYSYDWGGGITTEDRTGLAAGNYSVVITDANSCTKTINATVGLSVPVSGTTAVTNVSCFGGSNGAINLTPTGGTAPYTFNWGGGITTEDRTGLAAGNYSVIITDANGCSETINATVSQPTSLVNGTTVVTNVSCNGGVNGAINLTPTGGTAPYTFDWGGGITTEDRTGLAAGAYSVTITDANGCTKTLNVTVMQPTAINASTVVTNVSCNGGTNGAINLTPTGGTAPYTFNWGGGITTEDRSGLVAGNYSVIITDGNGCTKTVNVTVTQPTTIILQTSQDVPATCANSADGVATVNVTGGVSPYTYNWSNGANTATATGLAAGTYSVIVTDFNGCSQNTSIVISFVDTTAPVLDMPVLPTITKECAVVAGDIVAPTATDNCAGSITATTIDPLTYAQQGTYTITWLYDDGNGNRTTQTQTVVVDDVTAPVTNMNVLPTITKECAVVTGDIVAPTATDNCVGTLTATTTDPLTYTQQGTYTITWVYNDGNGNTTTQNQTVVVDDVTAPVPNMTVLPTITKECAVVTGDIIAPTATDNCVGTLTATTTDALTYTQQGTYTITWLFNDGNGNTTTQTQTVVVDDVTAPVPNMTVLPTITKECAVVTGDIVAPTATDNCVGTLTATTTDPLTYTQQGTYTITWLYNDGNGNTTTQTQTVVVDDVTAPVPNMTVLPTITKECAVVTGDIVAPTATDNCVGTLTATTTDALTYTQQGTYTITWLFNDGNGNTTTQTQTVVVDDVTAPVPNMTVLPTITRECAVVTADIIAPTATDNCTGTLTATTNDPLNYTQQGTYTITWLFNDGNGNTTTQTQTIVVEVSPLDVVTFDNLTTVYNGSAHEIQVNNLPAGASVSYSISPDSGLNNAAINAGTYVVTAVVTPPATAVNCTSRTIVADLIIEKASQSITFNNLDVLMLENAADFQLTATASSQLPVSYTYTYAQSTPAATVTPEGWVTLVHSGSILITAHQDGNENFLPAATVSRELVIESEDASIQQIVVNGQVYTNPESTIYVMQDCENLLNNVEVEIEAEFGSQVTPAREFFIQTPKPGVYKETVKVVSQNGANQEIYNVIVERPFVFEDIVIQKFDNTLLVNNNPKTNGGYKFVAYKWYRNDVLIGTEQVYSVGSTLNDQLDENVEYSVTVTTDDGQEIHTCPSTVTRVHDLSMKVYPNPVQTNSTFTIDFGTPSKSYEGTTASIFTTDGKLLFTTQIVNNNTAITLPSTIAAGMYMLVVESNEKQFKEVVKIVVKQ